MIKSRNIIYTRGKYLKSWIIIEKMNHEPEVKATDMEEDMIKRVKEIAINAVKEYKQEK